MSHVGPLLSRAFPRRSYQASGDDGCAEGYGGTGERNAPTDRSQGSGREDHQPTEPEIETKNGFFHLILCLCRVVGFVLAIVGGALGLVIGLILLLVGYPREKLLEMAERMKNWGLDENEE